MLKLRFLNIALGYALLATLAVTLSQRSYAGDGVIAYEYSDSSDPEPLTVLVVSHGLQLKGSDPGIPPSLAAPLMRLGHDWVFEQFKLRYPDIPPSVFDARKASDSPLAGESVIVIVYANNNVHDVRAVIRYVMPSEAGLPLEKDLDWSYPSPDLSFGPYSHIEFDTKRTGPYDHLETVTPINEFYRIVTKDEIQGGASEIKNLAVGINEKRDLVPLLFFSAETAMANLPAKVVPRNLLEAWASHYNLDPGKNSGPIHFDAVPVYPSNYVLECDGRMINYYRSFGFSLVSETPIKGNDFVLDMGRPRYMGIARKMRLRPGMPRFDHLVNVDRATLHAWEKRAEQRRDYLKNTFTFETCVEALSKIESNSLGMPEQK